MMLNCEVLKGANLCYRTKLLCSLIHLRVCAIFCVRMLVCHLFPSVPVLSQSLNMIICFLLYLLYNEICPCPCGSASSNNLQLHFVISYRF